MLLLLMISSPIYWYNSIPQLVMQSVYYQLVMLHTTFTYHNPVMYSVFADNFQVVVEV